jgi:KDO2-lipid IV(A) lauroyltransferase
MSEQLDALTMLGYRAASVVARRTPASVAAGASFVAGGSLALALRDRRRIIERHFRRIDPNLDDRALRTAVTGAFNSYARYYLETLRLPALSSETIEEGFTVEGYHHIEAAIARGKGAILALPHLGGWEWAGRWLSAQGHNVTAVVENLENRELFAWFSDLRSKIGIDVIAFDDRAGIRVGAALRENHVVCLLCDRDIARAGKRTGVAVDFFGEQTTVPAGPALFAIRTGAALLPVATYFTNRVDGHHGVIRPPIEVERTASLREDIARTTQVLIGEVEALIRREPTQWHLFQPNWPSDPGY